VSLTLLLSVIDPPISAKVPYTAVLSTLVDSVQSRRDVTRLQLERDDLDDQIHTMRAAAVAGKFKKVGQSDGSLMNTPPIHPQYTPNTPFIHP